MASRGRGGAGIGSRMRGQNLPFEIDPELAEVADQSFEDGPQDESAKDIFPDYGPVVLAAAVTDSERRQVQILRELDAKRRAGPFWTGTKEDWARIDSMSGSNAVYNPFECANGSGKRGIKRPFKMVDLKTIKLEPRFFPKDLHKIIGHNSESTGSTDGPHAKQRKLGLAKKSTLDRLARFDDDHEDQPNGDTNKDYDDADSSNSNAEEGEDFDAEPEDDVFDEDEDDAGNDYNAEAYFDGGDDDFEEGGGGEYGDDVF